ncbi:MAG: ATP-binding protein [Pseudobdellovibrionaceae bacterium]|nr:ATP-binding protein [Pseudobdellovibrionaceae bacterium]
MPMNLIPILCFLLLAPAMAWGTSRTPVKIEEGKVEIRDYKNEILRLTGDWRFIDTNISSIDEAQFKILPLKNAYLGNTYWSFYAPGPARGAFIVRIDADRPYSLFAVTPGLSARSQLLIINDQGRREIFVDDEFGQKSLEKTRRELTNVTFPLDLAKGSNYVIVNYEQEPVTIGGVESVAAGFRGQFEIGPQQDFLREIFAEKVTLLIPTGIFFCLGIYSLLIYVSRRGRDLESLLLFGFNISMFIKEIASQNVLGYFIQSNALTQLVASSVMYTPILTSYFGIYVVALLVKSKLLRVLRGICLVLALAACATNFILTLASRMPDIQDLNWVYIGCSSAVFFLVFLPYVIIYGIQSKRMDILLLGMGYLALTAGILFDVYKVVTSIDFPWMAMWGGTVLSVVFARNNSKMFALTFERSEQLNQDLHIKNAEVRDLNASLEVKVLERTAEVRSLMQHIPQGILTIVEGGIIGQNFSAHLPELTGRSDIAGQSFKEMIFDRSELSRNAIDQAWQSILASLGEDVMNFEVNIDNLPTEFAYHGTHPMVLKCTWNVELDAQDTVKRILVTLLDVTTEVEARRKLDAKNKEFNIVRQLLDIGTNKAKQFFSSGHQLLSENERLIGSAPVDVETVKILFVNMHTLKGAARTLQLAEISEVFHLVESYYADILRNGVLIEMDKLQSDFKPALKIFGQYEVVNRDVLGRTEDDSKVIIDRDFLERNFQILNFLDGTDTLDSNLQDVIHDNRDELIKLIFMSLPLMLDDTLKQANRIAKDLQKSEPHISIDMADILINHRQEIAIKNAFVHLLRNSLDHGIELPDVRISKGKDPRGHIKLAAVEEDNLIQLRFEDDGAGLDIARLRQKGLALQLIPANASVQEVAGLIFHQGMSTANAVSQVSGRGVGMDAVRRFIEAESGRVELHLGTCLDPELELYRFHFMITLPCQENRQTHRKRVA